MVQERIITDIPADRLRFVMALVEADGGTIKNQETEPDGEVTITATFPLHGLPASASPSAEEHRWMEIARQEIGTKEVSGSESNPRIEEYHATTEGGVQPDSVPWCSSFVNYCLKNAGIVGTNSKLARSWLEWGVESTDFVPGCIVVLKRGAAPKGHVGFYAGTENGNVMILGGNQNDQVSIAGFPSDRVIGCRMPT